MAVHFCNQGYLDIDAAITMGVHVKESNNPIGFFGTGLKYAIATLLRTGHSVSIKLKGEKPYKFGTVKKLIRGKEFALVTMNRKTLGFTTDLGKNWLVWQAFRELYSNMKDESGSCYDYPPKQDWDTTIIIDGPKIHDAYNSRHTIFIDQTLAPISRTGFGNIYPANIGGNEGNIYYRGVLVYKVDKPFMFTYNIHASVELTEDRTIKHYSSIEQLISWILAVADSEEVFRKWFTQSDETQYTELKYTVDRDLATNQVALKIAKEILPTQLLPAKVWECLKEKFKSRELTQYLLTDKEANDVVKAKQLLATAGFFIDDYEIQYVESLSQKTGNSRILGLAEDDTIYIDKLCFTKGPVFLASTLLEEYMHLRFNVYDCTREFQTLLLDEIIKLIKRNNHD